MTPERRTLLRLGAGWLLVALGALTLAAGWYGVSGEALVARQLPYLVSGGLAGLALVVVGVGLLVTTDARRLEDRLRLLERQVGELHAVLLQPPEDVPVQRGHETSGAVVALREGERFHAPSCPVVAGRAGVLTLTAGDAAARGLVACRVCGGAR